LSCRPFIWSLPNFIFMALWIFLVLGIVYSGSNSNSFSVFRWFLLVFQFGFCFLCPNKNQENTGKSPSNKGLRSEIERCLYSNFLTRRKGRERGRGRLTRRRHRPRIQAQSKKPHHRQTLVIGLIYRDPISTIGINNSLLNFTPILFYKILINSIGLK
jgi:hypothetical protein